MRPPVGGTINTQNGRIFFPVLEPFGSYLNRQLIGPTRAARRRTTLVRNIVFQQLYDSTKTAAQNMPELNRFKLKGSYRAPAAT
jgi:cell surface protein SprA